MVHQAVKPLSVKSGSKEGVKQQQGCLKSKLLDKTDGVEDVQLCWFFFFLQPIDRFCVHCWAGEQFTPGCTVEAILTFFSLRPAGGNLQVFLSVDVTLPCIAVEHLVLRNFIYVTGNITKGNQWSPTFPEFICKMYWESYTLRLLGLIPFFMSFWSEYKLYPDISHQIGCI